ncbi:UNVERIFIED_CONTAM: DNA polymerase-3 subunit delta' [Acetivibrio alkalicellulosi]
MNFNQIIGQDEVLDRIRTIIKNKKEGHAYIFSGSKGIGKKTIAEIFASIAICSEDVVEESCGKCKGCKLFNGKTNPDFYRISTKENSISVDDIRKMQKDVLIKPLYSPKKVYLIEDAQKLTLQAQNCLLKTLEEPPSYALIILTTSNNDALIETIRSRSVTFLFKKNTFDEVKKFLIDNGLANEREADFIAAYSDGVIGRAKELSTSNEFKENRDKAIEILLKINECKTKDIFSVYDFFERNKESIDEILDIMVVFYRDLLVVGKSGNENILINSDKKDIIVNNINNFSTEKLFKNIKAIDELRSNIRRNVNYQLAVEVMLMKVQEEIL